MMRSACAAMLAVGLAAPVAFAGETVTEHENYEKRSMKIETIPPPRVEENRTYEESTRRETERRPSEVEVEKKTRTQDGAVIKEKRTVETEEDDD